MTAFMPLGVNTSPYHSISPDYEPFYECDDSLYPETLFPKSEEKMTDKYFTIEGEKVYANLVQPLSPFNQSLPKFESVFSRNRCDSELSRDSGIPSPTNIFPSAAFDEEPKWHGKHPTKWTSEEVVAFLCDVASEHNIGHLVKAEKFRTVTGMDMYNMTAEDFKPLSEEYYPIFMRSFSQLKGRSNFKEPEASPPTGVSPASPPTGVNPASGPLLSQTSNYYQMQKRDSSALDSEVPDLSLMTECPETLSSTSVAVIGSHQYTFNQNETFQEISHMVHPISQRHLLARLPGSQMESDDLGYSSGESENARLVPNLESFNRASPPVHRSEISMQIEEAEEEQQPPEKPKKVPGKRGRKLGQTTRGNHLWEFMRDLLKDPRYNPSLVEWKDKKDGVFRVVQSAEVAAMWGKKKKNDSMNYEKLSRAMRFCRDKGYFASVPKEGKYPKKLCFRFGERAFGWQPTDTPESQQLHP